MAKDDDNDSTRVTLNRFELLHLKDFAASVDPGRDEEDLKQWDRLTQKLENALARLDNRDARNMTTKIIDWKPDQCAAECAGCGWKGTVTKTSPCPACGARVDPTLFRIAASE
jgi:hypothetical protein